MIEAYRKAGVDVKKGDRFVEFIKSIPSSAISGNLGGFAGGFELDTDRYRHPVIMTATDGVGTKLLIAQKLGIFDTVGIDLVAMCVNDLIANGAEPVSFLDYIACGSIDEPVMQDLIVGIVKGCEEAGCTLAGGETAEMPEVYDKKDFDLAGFAVGVVEKDNVLPKLSRMNPGAQLWGLPSAGIHANGLSLARKVLPLDDQSILEELLRPTVIYVKSLKNLLSTGKILGVAHITGGGLINNIKRIVPPDLDFELSYDWPKPWIFNEIQKRAEISRDEMRRVYNLGIGMAIAVQESDSVGLMEDARRQKIELIHIGKITSGR